MNSESLAIPQDFDRQQLQHAIAEWYQHAGRRLPWRDSTDPYRIWISEIMLQQTTVAAVVPYFERFLARFPDVRSLAAGAVEEVLRLWEGLGYYSRARNLHKAAGIIVERYDGRMPVDARLLQSLPGIGRYTAGAIASFAFNLPAPIVEANTLRLFSRLMAMDIDPRSAAGQRQLWNFAEWLVGNSPSPLQPLMKPGDLNQALMDLGATVCVVSDPRCVQCPIARFCRAQAQGKQHQIPRLPKRVAMTEVIEASIAVRRNGKFLMRQRTEKERWAGLWDFLRFEVTETDAAAVQGLSSEQNTAFARQAAVSRRSQRSPDVPALFAADGAMMASEETVSRQQPLPSAWIHDLLQQTGLLIPQGVVVTEIRHTVTRYRIRLLCIDGEVAAGRLRSGNGLRWFTAEELSMLPLSTTGRKFAQMLGMRN